MNSVHGPEPVRQPPASPTSPWAGIQGLTAAEARQRLAAEGPNALTQGKRRGMPAIALEVAREPMFVLLTAAGTIYLLMGAPTDALMLLAFVLVVMTITIVQELRTERALDALRELASPHAQVIRDGIQQRIAGHELVRGDFIVVAEGDRVPADAILRQAHGVAADESLLTGESVPVRKLASADTRSCGAPGGDDQPGLFSGTLVTAGQGLAEVAATGRHAEIGKIGEVLRQLDPEPTLLQRETRRLVRVFAVVGLVACAIVVIAFALTRGGGIEVWKQGLLAGIALAMAVLPEEFPVILTVFLALGAWRLARHRVLARRLPVIETLGAATVLCVDKTGTLTENRMTLRHLATAAGSIDLSGLQGGLAEPEAELLRHAVWASKVDAFDPMERALNDAGQRLLPPEPPRAGGWTVVREYPLAPDLLAVTHAWGGADDADVLLATKGAPEAVVALCRLEQGARDRVMDQATRLAATGCRVLGVARGRAARARLPPTARELDLSFLGLIAFEDPLRASVPAAVAECQAAGVRVVMITGDYAATAQSIARQAGLEQPEAVVTGPELERMTERELAARCRDVHVFARVVPEHKLRIVNAFKAAGEIVAMTGDGVNDAPALKSAHIGIAMGKRGTDVAREAASLVLLEDDFSSIAVAIGLGRRIYDNIRKAVAFVLAVHLPIIGLSMLSVFFAGWPLVLLPVHIAFLELIIDPACSLIFEAEAAEPDVMRRPPRRSDERLFSRRILGPALAQGGAILILCTAVFLLARTTHDIGAARALTFAALVTAVLGVILVNRSWQRTALAMLGAPNRALGWVVAGAGALRALALLAPAARPLLHFTPVPAWELALALGAGLLSVAWFDWLKPLAAAAPPRRGRVASRGRE
jgi:Ca2+-transporting ATPase